MSSYEKLDHWSLKAQKEAYPARSVYKLKELDEKLKLFSRRSPATRVLDLGAAPGSWSLYVLRRWPQTLPPEKAGSSCGATGDTAAGILLTAADLQPLSRAYDGGLFDRGDFFFIQGDFTDGEIRDEIAKRGPYSHIISDAAPATSGNRTVDTLRSLELAETALSYADSMLAKGGCLVMKIFQGGGAPELLKRMRKTFRLVKSYKPQSCRADSFECYYTGMDFKPEGMAPRADERGG